MARPLAIISAGMVTGVGLSAPSSCAAIRAGITGFNETQFMDQGGKWILGSYVPLPIPYRGTEKLIQMAKLAVAEALAGVENLPVDNIPLLLCVAEATRAGRFADLDESILPRLQQEIGKSFHRESRLIPQGRMAGVTALQIARSAVFDTGFPYCLMVGVDTFLVASTLASYESRYRLLTSQNSNGFIPGEAAAAVLLGRADGDTKLSVLGLGSGNEPAPIESGEPLRADGLVGAFRSVLADSGVGWEELDYRITDLNGEQYSFRETALALTRCLRTRKEEFDLWHAADCVGEVGAAAVPLALSIALNATIKNYAPGPGVLCHFSCDGPERAAVILKAA